MNQVLNLLLEKYGKWVLIGAILYFASEIGRNWYAIRESKANIKKLKGE